MSTARALMTAREARLVAERMQSEWITAVDYAVVYRLNRERANDLLRAASRVGLVERARLKDTPLDAWKHRGSIYAYRVAK